ncbi:hypothetical protein [Actinacidiphila sp. ITFR-21]|uniref:VG15 protein n=1 Tax=Actinacidiphila sp. ITFR-21 TaxID=3075199 RepID=UPI002889538B|nr:hypothetical protein [Streptomyces sp. ITFR-21]WNI16917.1 hypothetical protein RLT57_16235 [Streptomyces sp. ITFR-21]
MAGPTRAAERRRAQQQLLALRTMRAADRLWREVSPTRITASWRTIANHMAALLIAAQQAAAAGAQSYVDDVVTELGGESDPAGDLNPAAFAGRAADGRSLASLLDQPRITTLTNLAAGAGPRQALDAGRVQLLRIVGSETADAGRSAAGAGITSNRTCTGYVRVIAPGACNRCVILAGMTFHTEVAFRRHPHCHCTNEPTIAGRSRPHTDPDAYFHSLTRAQQEATFGRAGARAIRDGADINAVVNIRRRGALYTTTDAYGRRVQATREGTTRRGAYYRAERARISQQTGIRYARDRIEAQQGLPAFRLAGARLTPEAIYQTAATREDAIALLRQYGYLI